MPRDSDGASGARNETAADDEFRYVREDAARLGVIPLAAQRATSMDAEGRVVSRIAWGEGDPQVITLHGAALNAHSWDSTLLSVGRAAWAIDLPGHGRSDWRDDADYRPRTLAHAIVEVVRDLSAPVVLVGHSRGGLAALHVAAALPSLVRSLVIVDNAPSYSGGSGHSERLRQFRARTSFASRDEVVDHALTIGIGTDRESLLRGVIHNTRVTADGRVEWAHHLARLPARQHDADEESEQWELWRQLPAPLTLVHGSRGILTRADLDAVLEHRRSTRLVELAAGHNVQRDAPRELAAVIAEELEALSGP